LIEFFKRPADLELMMRPGASTSTSEKVLDTIRAAGTQLGWKMPAAKRVEVLNTKDRPVPGKVQPDEGGLNLSMGDANLALAAEDTLGFSRYSNIQRFYLQQFDMADVDKKGVLDKKMAMGIDFLYELFLLADRDGDGKLTRKELTSFLEMMEQGSRCFTVLTVTDYGRDLFELLDDNHDGNLSPREWRTAWTRIKPLSRDGVGLTRTDVPRRFTVSAGQGNGFGGRRVRVNRAPGQMGEPSKGPVWFRKMDRNGDGDVSRAEFLGTEEDFRKIDEDGDGLISLEEAIRYEAKLKKSKPTPGDSKAK
jgi:Ca2+-binding EF-hand superfamily protein